MRKQVWTIGRLPRQKSRVQFNDHPEHGYGSEELAKLKAIAASGYGSLVASALYKVETDSKAETVRIRVK